MSAGLAPWDEGYEASREIDRLRWEAMGGKRALVESPASARLAEVERLASQALMKREARLLTDRWIAEKEGQGQKLALLTEADLHEMPDLEWWVEGFLPKGSDTEIASPGGIMKTFTAIHTTRCLASGMQWFGRDVQKTRALYVLGEGLAGFGQRVRAWDERFADVIVPTDSISYLRGGVNFSNPDDVARLREMFKEGGYGLLVVDTLSKLGGYTDENNSGQMTKALQGIQTVREGGGDDASSLILHHTDKAGNSYRGNSANRDNVDVLWMMRRARDGSVTLSSFSTDGGKTRDGTEERIAGFRLVDSGASAVVEWAGSAPSSPYWEPVRSMLAVGGWRSGAELRTACGIDEARGQEYDRWKSDIAQWVRGGMLTKRGPSNRPEYSMLPVRDDAAAR